MNGRQKPSTRLLKAATEETAFSLVELSLVMLVIAILIAITVPSFLGAQEKAKDKDAQADLQIAIVTEEILRSDGNTYSEDLVALAEEEPSVVFELMDSSLAVPADTGKVYLDVAPPDGRLYLSSRSGGGDCFYLRSIPVGTGGPIRARDSSCDPAGTQTYSVDAW